MKIVSILNEKTLLIIPFILFCASLLLPAVGGNDPAPGYMILMMGPQLMTQLHLYAWYANIFGPIGFIFAILKGYKQSIVFSLIAFITGLQSLNFAWLTNQTFHTNYPFLSLEGLGIGFYLWECSFFVTALYCFILLRQKFLPGLKV